MTNRSRTQERVYLPAIAAAFTLGELGTLLLRNNIRDLRRHHAPVRRRPLDTSCRQYLLATAQGFNPVQIANRRNTSVGHERRLERRMLQDLGVHLKAHAVRAGMQTGELVPADTKTPIDLPRPKWVVTIGLLSLGCNNQAIGHALRREDVTISDEHAVAKSYFNSLFTAPLEGNGTRERLAYAALSAGTLAIQDQLANPNPLLLSQQLHRLTAPDAPFVQPVLGSRLAQLTQHYADVDARYRNGA